MSSSTSLFSRMVYGKNGNPNKNHTIEDPLETDKIAITTDKHYGTVSVDPETAADNFLRQQVFEFLKSKELLDALRTMLERDENAHRDYPIDPFLNHGKAQTVVVDIQTIKENAYEAQSQKYINLLRSQGVDPHQMKIYLAALPDVGSSLRRLCKIYGMECPAKITQEFLDKLTGKVAQDGAQATIKLGTGAAGWQLSFIIGLKFLGPEAATAIASGSFWALSAITGVGACVALVAGMYAAQAGLNAKFGGDVALPDMNLCAKQLFGSVPIGDGLWQLAYLASQYMSTTWGLAGQIFSFVPYFMEALAFAIPQNTIHELFSSDNPNSFKSSTHFTLTVGSAYLGFDKGTVGFNELFGVPHHLHEATPGTSAMGTALGPLTSYLLTWGVAKGVAKTYQPDIRQAEEKFQGMIQSKNNPRM